ncbi:MAG: hypothetical protein QME58_12895 [Bacteroidota bacterium]|nr:hypothetical protein [Bacteroidota bacterium]
MKKLFLFAAMFTIMSYNAYACFDTYLFLHRSSMVYPHKSLVFELNGEYSINKFNSPNEDSFLSSGSIYYGLADRFSTQISIGSDDKSRGEYKIDFFGIRGVFNAYSSQFKDHTADLILEYRAGFQNALGDVEFSVPNIFRTSDITYVLHPTLNYTLQEKNFQFGGHTGLFYNFSDNSVIGVGAEYLSPQSGSYVGNRITQSEVAASFFFGSHIGESIFIQNELAKGLANSRDFGFALTVKLLR